ncbi:MAG: ribosome-associated translation inhibitor RaiA [Desulfonauticus sp.]|nr:ribosome-associated translation inhibitor RaiA [Desulfonauticus sp.]
MEIKFNFKNFEPSEHLKNYAQTRFSKLSKYISDKDNLKLEVNFEVEKYRHIIEAILTAKNLHISAKEEHEDMYASVDLVLDKLEAQVKKLREKAKSKHRNKVRMDVIQFNKEDKKGPVIVETDHFEPKPMSVEEAALQLDTLNYEFLVFLNAEEERINVIYKRKDGNFGLIDPGI